MPVIRYLVNDVDASLPFYKILGFKLADRWGPPFAIVKRKSLSIWLSGPGTSARKKLKSGDVPEPGGWNRLVLEVKDIDATVTKLEALGAKFRSKPIKGPGGKQVLVEDPVWQPNRTVRTKARVRSNPSLKRSANGRPPGPRGGLGYPPPRGPGVLPSSPA